MKMFYKISDYLNKAEAVFLIIGMSTIVLSIFLVTVLRFLFATPVPWAEELARISFVWTCWIGAGYAVSSHDHLTMDVSNLIIDKLKNPEKAYAVQTIVSWTLVVVYLGVYIVFYNDSLLLAKVFSRSTAALRWNLGVVKMAPMIGSILMLYHAVFCCIIPRKQDKAAVAVESTGGDE